MASDYHFDGFDEWEKKLSQMIEHDYPEEFKAVIIQIAEELQGRTKEKTPHKTGHLQDSWKVGQIKKSGDAYYIEVANDISANVKYAEPVEYGHRTRGGKGFVPGVHMFELSLEEVSQWLPSFLNNWLNDFLNSHDL